MLEFSDFQFALLKRAGCLEASMLLHSILRNAHDSTKALAMLSLDILKAFDTIFYYAVLKSARKACLPPPLVKCVVKRQRRGKYKMWKRSQTG